MPRAVPVPRLKRRADFLRIAAGRRKWAAPGLVLQVAPGVDESVPTRVGFTASKKVGNSVARNRARRRLRAAVAELLPRHGMPGLEYVVIAREATGARDWPALLADLETAMRRLKAWQDGPSA